MEPLAFAPALPFDYWAGNRCGVVATRQKFLIQANLCPCGAGGLKRLLSGSVIRFAELFRGEARSVWRLACRRLPCRRGECARGRYHTDESSAFDDKLLCTA